MPKNTQTTQNRNNQQFDQEHQKYEAELSKYKSQLSTATSIDPTQIIENLHFVSEPQASLSVDYVTQPDSKTHAPGEGYDVGFWGGYYSKDQPGTFFVANYDNLQNSYYVDSNGAKHSIAKMKVVYSNLVLDKARNSTGWFGVCSPDALKGPEGDDWKNNFIAVGMDFVKSVDQQFFFYDENGNLINMDPSSTFMPIASLNRWSAWKTGPDHIEKVQVLSGGKLYTIPGGNSTLHSDGLYDDKESKDYPSHAFSNVKNDGGAGVASISNGVKFRWTQTGEDDQGDGANKVNNWYYFTVSTDALNGISMTPPVRKITQTNYHYDTSPIFFILSLWWLSMQAYIIAIAFTSYVVVLSIHA